MVGKKSLKTGKSKPDRNYQAKKYIYIYINIYINIGVNLTLPTIDFRTVTL